jgi:hypothetical protein
MSAHGPDLSSVFAQTPRSIPRSATLFGWIAVAAGLAATVLGVATDADRTRAAFVVNFVYFFGACQGALMLAAIFSIIGARWGRPLKRVAEALGLFTAVMYALLLVFLLTGGTHLYPWSHEPMPAHKAVYLTPSFFVARQVVGVGLLVLLNLLYVRTSLRPDLGVVAARIGEKAPSWWARLTGDWKGEEAEIDAARVRMGAQAPVLAIAYAFLMSVMVVDMSMSLAPHWYANMFPVWYFASCFWCGLVFIGIASHLSKRWLGIEHLLTGKVYHDLGKLTFGFTMFWGYTLFAMYLAIWYGNMTEEIGYILLRTELEPWATLSKVVVSMCFLLPFSMLLSRGIKKIPSAYLMVLGVIAIGIWLERFLVVQPSVWTHEGIPLGPIEIGMTLGLLGALVLVYTRFMSQVPPVPVSDPFMQPNPDDVHVHPSHGHAH